MTLIMTRNEFLQTALIVPIAGFFGIKVLPHWDKAVALSSDLASRSLLKDAMITLYMYPEKWEVETVCSVCDGSKTVQQKVYKPLSSEAKIERVECSHCRGTGKMTRGPCKRQNL